MRSASRWGRWSVLGALMLLALCFLVIYYLLLRPLG
jgi:hypothetical protein